MSRLFFALWPDPVTRASMAAMMELLPAGCGKLVKPENLHITLVFLGNVNRDQEQCVLTGAAGIQCTPVTLTLDILDWWSRPQMVWLGSRQSSVPLASLVEELRALAQECDIKTESRPFVPHVTLARKVSRSISLSLSRPVIWSASTFALVRSETRPDGPRYDVIWTSSV